MTQNDLLFPEIHPLDVCKQLALSRSSFVDGTKVSLPGYMLY